MVLDHMYREYRTVIIHFWWQGYMYNYDFKKFQVSMLFCGAILSFEKSIEVMIIFYFKRYVFDSSKVFSVLGQEYLKITRHFVARILGRPGHSLRNIIYKRPNVKISAPTPVYSCMCVICQLDQPYVKTAMQKRLLG